VKGLGETFVTVLATLWVTQLATIVFLNTARLPSSLQSVAPWSIKALHVVFSCVYMLLLWLMFIRTPADARETADLAHEANATLAISSKHRHLLELLSRSSIENARGTAISYLVAVCVLSIAYSALLRVLFQQVSLFNGILPAVLITFAAALVIRDGLRA
jgi:hypothetical protein